MTIGTYRGVLDKSRPLRTRSSRPVGARTHPWPANCTLTPALGTPSVELTFLRLAAQSAWPTRSTPPIGYLFDNWAWENSLDALIAGSGQPQVRAGVLRILATLPGVTVTSGTTGGQPTLVLTSGAAETGAGYTEQLTINASTGVPVSFVGGSSVAQPAATVTYQVTRVTLSDVSRGRL